MFPFIHEPTKLLAKMKLMHITWGKFFVVPIECSERLISTFPLIKVKIIYTDFPSSFPMIQ